jgi:transposase InsO family protein
VKIFRDEIFKHHGLLRKVISDRGPQYVSKFMMDLYSLLGIKGNPSTAFHPQTDGQMERINQEVEQYLRIWVNHVQDDWLE